MAARASKSPFLRGYDIFDMISSPLMSIKLVWQKNTIIYIKNAIIDITKKIRRLPQKRTREVDGTDHRPDQYSGSYNN